ncbi:MAG TPA: DUF92 domain-containing protein [Candidatus Polarisedimenticolia bacterium]|nr:DUF92 domain-containing protein [Candidatus Polarisedimenticolia bacterium]
MSAAHSPAARRIVHAGSGLLALLLKSLTVPQAALVAGGACLFNYFVLPRIGASLFRSGERRRPLQSGIHIYPFAVLLLVLLFGWRMEVAAAAWVIFAAGDPAASFAGERFGRHRLPWNHEKSCAGTLAFLLAASLGGWAILVFMGRSGEEAVWLMVPTALFAAFVESLPWRLNDNLSVPLLSALFLCAFIEGDAIRLPEVAASLAPAFAIGAVVNALLAALFLAVGAVDRSGAVGGFAVGTLTWGFGGWRAFAILVAFFVLGTLTTRLGRGRKERLGVAQEKRGARSARHAIANCGVAVVLALLTATAATPGLFALAFVCAYATAAFDTVSSEVGQAWGGKPVLITTLKRVPIGTDGAVSLLGTLAGLGAAALVGGLAVGLGMVPASLLPLVLLAAFVGSSADSLLGATLERRGLLDNEAVNFSNTLIGALAGVVGGLLTIRL